MSLNQKQLVKIKFSHDMQTQSSLLNFPKYLKGSQNLAVIDSNKLRLAKSFDVEYQQSFLKQFSIFISFPDTEGNSAFLDWYAFIIKLPS